MHRVAIIGSAGSGKSTLAVTLGRHLGLPVTHLDRLFWRPGWTPMPRADFIMAQERLVTQDRWIIDGNYDGTLPIRLAAADTIVFLDLPTPICFGRVVRRSFAARTRPDMGEGCQERVFTKDFGEFLLWVWNYRRNNRPRVLSLLAEHGRGKRLHQLRSTTAVSSFLKDYQ